MILKSVRHKFFIFSIMQTLFPLDNNHPPGFEYYPGFISPEEEGILLDIISRTELHTFIFQGYEAKRKVASFGYDWSFEKRSLSKGKEIPREFLPLIEKVSHQLSLNKKDIGEFLILEYPAGAVINWHRDAPPFDLIAGISLLSDCVFKLRPYDKAKQGRGSIVSLPIARRSLYVMKDDARSQWEHSTAPVKQKRYSITLRTLK
jgi:alkylated DNA repair dioxygenase AlkB